MDAGGRGTMVLRYPWLTACFLLCLVSPVLAGRKASQGELTVEAVPSTVKEGVTGLMLLCRYTTSPNETVHRVVWSRVQGQNLAVIFEKFYPAGGQNYTFSGPWKRGKAKHDVMTLADVSIEGADVTRDDAGKYRCEVSSDVNTAYSDTTVTVLYGPGNSIRITSQQGSFRIEEGETITLICAASCVPSCQFRWTCSGCRATRAAMLTIPSIQRDQSGTYTCLAYNSISRGRTDVTIDVLYSSVIQQLHFAGGGKTTEMEEGQSVSISCQATGNPPPDNITWSVTGQSKLNQTFGMRYRNDRSSVFMLRSASCHDNDEYSCTTANSLGADVDSVHLKVLCAPEPSSELCHHGNGTVITPFAQTTNLTACVIARPMPTVHWHHVIYDVSTPVLNHGVRYDDVRARLLMWVSVTATKADDYGVYRVTVENERGSYEETFHVVSREIPQPPQNLTVINVTLTSFCVTWLAGFDGGAAQTFLLMFYTQSDDVGTKHTEVSTGDVDNDVISHCLKNLKEDTIYDVKVCAENEYGRSGEVVIRATTLTETRNEPVSSDEAKLLWLKIGGLLGFYLIFVFIFTILYCGQRHRSFNSQSENSAELKHQAPLCVYNENVRLSYLETSRQGSYVDATSTARAYVTDDDVTTTSDVSDGSQRDRRGSWVLGMGRQLGVDDLSRRPSSTSTENIYMDVLGEPSTYMNQDTAEESQSSYMNTHSDPYEVTSFIENVTDATEREGRLTELVEDYVDMTNRRVNDDVNNSGDVSNTDDVSDTGDISLKRGDYDDAWCGVLPGVVSAEGGRPTPVSSQEDCYTNTAPLNVGRSPSHIGVIPTITVHDARGVRRDCTYHVCDVDNTCDDEEHIYHVIEDRD